MQRRLLLPILTILALLAFELHPAHAGILRDAIAMEESWGVAERQDVQDALIWSGDYSGRLDGDFGPGTRGAIEAFQARNGFWATGHLTSEGLAALHRERRARIAEAGFEIRRLSALGVTIGIPETLLGAPESKDFGLDFVSPDASGLPSLTIYSGPVYTAREFQAFYDDAVARDVFDRDVYQVFRGDWLVFTGMTGDGTKQYSYMRNTPYGIRGFAFFYDAGDADRFDRIMVAMFNSLTAFEAAGPDGVVSGDNTAPRFLPPKSETREYEGDRIVGGRRDGKSTSRTDGGRIDRHPDDPQPERAAEPEQEAAPEYSKNDEGKPRGRRPRRDNVPDGDEPDRDAQPRQGRRPAGPVIASGSGFYVNGQGALLTNQHVIEGCSALRINDEIGARTLRFDRGDDLALLQADAPGATPYLAFRPGRARLNEDVTVIGFPLWGLLEEINVTRGSISSLVGLEGDRRMVQITAPVQSGNSGGPVLDAMGRVVGVVQSKLDTLLIAEEMGEIAQNINFAIEGGVAQQFLTGAGTAYTLTSEAERLSPPDLADQASQATVLVECLGD
jgi:S1-C subfamily serine protease